MTCKECKTELSYLDHKTGMEAYGVELCSKHKKRIDKLIRSNKTPLEAIQLYYGLKEIGVYPMLEWWDGKKSVDIAISRVKLNIEIDTEYQMLTHEQAMNNLEETMHSFKNGFTTVRIPHVVIKHFLGETVQSVLGIIEGLKVNVKVI
jgi:acyl CoA:acetate/3-ketoacid CoA transferase alpha subunit